MDEMDTQEQITRMPQFRTGDDGKTIRWKVDPEDTIDEICHFLNGDSWDNEEEKWVVNRNPDLMLVNSRGIRAIETKLRSVLNKNVVLSNLEEEMINQIAMNSAINMIKLIYTSHDQFAIDKKNFDLVIEIIDNNVYSALRRAARGLTLNHLSTTQRYIEQSSMIATEKEKKGGMFPSVFNWKKE